MADTEKLNSSSSDDHHSRHGSHHHNSSHHHHHHHEEPETYQETTQTITAGGDTVEVGINKNYLKTPPGILKIIEFILGAACIICAGLTLSSTAAWGGFVGGLTIFFSTIWFCLYACNVDSKFHPVMLIMELIYCVVFIILYVSASIVAITSASAEQRPVAFYAFAGFGFAAALAFLCDVYFRFNYWRSASSIQRTDSKSKHTTIVELEDHRHHHHPPDHNPSLHQHHHTEHKA